MKSIRILRAARLEIDSALRKSIYPIQLEELIVKKLRDIAGGLLAPASNRDNAFYDLILRKFPYYLVVDISDAEVVVIALSHKRRRRGYWKRRTKQI